MFIVADLVSLNIYVHLLRGAKGMQGRRHLLDSQADLISGLTVCYWVISYAFVVCWFFFIINFFEKLLQEYNQSVKQFRFRWDPTILSGLIWVQTVCIGYHQMTLVDKELTFRFTLFINVFHLQT